jgi:hypothetical protein
MKPFLIREGQKFNVWVREQRRLLLALRLFCAGIVNPRGSKRVSKVLLYPSIMFCHTLTVQVEISFAVPCSDSLY